MILSNQFLELCSEAKQAGFPLITTPGSQIGRGFADLGFEVFSCMPNSKLISLLTGEVSEFQQGQADHFFSVPVVDQVIEAIEQRDRDIQVLERVEKREWRVVLTKDLAQEVEVTDRELVVALLTSYIQL